MPKECSIGSVQALFTLPQPLDPNQGKIQVGNVLTISGSRKRKRAETCVGIDGDSVNLYNIRLSRLIVSHALPPQAYLTAPPCTVYRRGTGQQGHAEYFTYAAVRNNLAKSRYQICCFMHGKKPWSRSRSRDQAQPGSLNIELGSAEDEAVYIDAVPGTSTAESADPAHKVIVLQKSGHITCLSADLTSELWTASAAGLDSSVGESSQERISVEFANLGDVKTVRQGLLKNAHQALALLDSYEEGQMQPPHDGKILCVVLRLLNPEVILTKQLQLRVLYIESRSSRSTHVHQPVHPLVSWTLPARAHAADSHSGAQNTKYALGVPAATLQRLSAGTLSVYDLSTTTPQIMSEFHEKTADIKSFLPVSPSISLVSTEQLCSMYDIRYQSRRASSALASSLATDRNRKRKRAQSSTTARQIEFKQYMQSLEVAIGVAGRDIVAVQIQLDGADRKRRKHESGRLVDSVGRAVESTAEDDPAALGIFRALEHATTQKQFDDVFFKSLNSDVQSNRKLARYALSKIFVPRTTAKPQSQSGPAPPSKLRIALFPQKTCSWLLEMGYITAEEIYSTFARNPFTSYAVDRITAVDVVNALANHDQSLGSLSKMVITGGRLGLSGTVEALKLFIRSFEAHELPTPTKLLTEGEDNANDDGLDQQIKAEEDAAALELSLAMSSLREGASTRATALRTCLAHLPTLYAPTQIVQAFQSQLTLKELVTMIDLLRFELAEGGWMTRYVDHNPYANESSSSQDEAIAIVCSLLNCTLDALGIGGWLATPSVPEEDHAQTLISFLRSETSAVLEGIQESSFFKGFLKDFFRFEREVKQPQRRRKEGVREEEGVREVESAIPPQKADVILPLGLRSLRRIPETRVAAGGELQKRSKRDIGRKLSERVGKYTFESIQV